jgi:hypothetical protein
VAACGDVEVLRFHLAVVLGFDGVRARRNLQQEDRTLRRKVDHRASAAVADAQVHVRDEFVAALVALANVICTGKSALIARIRSASSVPMPPLR